MQRRVHVEETFVPMRDGTLLATDVYVPEGGSSPALVIRTPYGRSGSRREHDPLRLARSGWGVVIQDVRGRFASQGKFEPFHQEIADGTATVEWCARLPWCDGRVAMAGRSYVGATATLAALGGSKHLKAISPQLTAGDFAEGWTYEGGAMRAGFARGWAAGFATGEGYPEAVRRDALTLALDPRNLATSNRASRKLAKLFPPYRRWLDPKDASYWRPISVRKAGGKPDVAAIHVAGWFDIFCEGSIRYYQTMVERAAAGRAGAQRLIIGPWTHHHPFEHLTSEADFGLRSNWDLSEKTFEVFDWLRDAIDGKRVDVGVSAFFMGSNEWRELSDWPPAAKPLVLYLGSTASARSLHGDGTLTAAPSGEAGRDTYVHDPDDPVPSLGGRILSSELPLPGPMDQRRVEERDDVLVYTSEPLPEDVTVAGQVKASIHFTTSGRSADVCVKLVQVHPDGRAMSIVDSVKRIHATPGRKRVVEVDVGSTATSIPKGHRIRIEIASSNSPRLDVDPSTGEHASVALRRMKATQTVHHGGRAASCIVLPLMEPVT